MTAPPDPERRLGRLAWPEVAPAGRPKPIVALPLGSTEQHGPHLPAETDTTIARALAAGLADRRDDVLVAPALSYGASGEHAGFPATASLGTDVLRAALVEIVRSLDDTARAVVVVNGHGGNTHALGAATTLLTSEGRRVLAWSPGPSRPGSGDLHAGRDETSVMLHLAPGLVRMDVATDGPSPSLATLVEHGVKALSPTGVLGDPAGATEAHGKALFARWTDDLAGAVAAWEGTHG